ncbi:calcium-translocating P-type ATPase [Nadsonia fulvescens var. elongata DSM 6958]|uniref:Calcium-transporting ATPase n=1 Tax=Nadsonia fulvescens var. elongata DSM 6958 TaxID=857566 RepID=A0A1E3PSP3_9ASCO|nr:calcium-translocating P-type ATPase [Nadsonia fulvescens var. elongata DSM 6958]
MSVPRITIDTTFDTPQEDSGSPHSSPILTPIQHGPLDTLNKIPNDHGTPTNESLAATAQELLESTGFSNHNNNTNNSSPFSLSPEQLSLLTDTKNPYLVSQLGGSTKILSQLQTSSGDGLSADHSQDLSHDRIAAYGRNVLPEKKTKSIFELMWIGMHDQVIILLSIAAAVSLALGIYQTFGQPPEHDSEGNELPKVDWIEGVAIIVAIIIVIVVGAANDWQKERQFVKLNRKKEDRQVRAVRSGKVMEISVYDILVGDIIMLEPGDMIPTDGLLLDGHNLCCDESSATGESATIKKISLESLENLIEANSPLLAANHGHKADAFIISGSKVLEGIGHFVVTAVGPHSMHGRTMMSLQTEAEETPLQVKLNGIANGIAKFGSLAALVLFIVLVIRFLARLPGSIDTPSQKGQNFVKILITAITIIVVAVPEGLPLAVTLALAFATTRMVKDNNLVRVLKACETMGGATTVCSDKTGTLTQNKMTVVVGSLGTDTEFDIPVDKDHVSSENHIDVVLPQISETAKSLLFDSITLNSTAFEAPANAAPNSENYVGSKTESAMLDFAKYHLGLQDLASVRAHQPPVEIFPFDSAKKCMMVVIRKPNDSGFRVLVKGASEIILAQCNSIYQFRDDSVRAFNENDCTELNDRIERYGTRSLRAITMAYRDFDGTEWPPATLTSSALDSGKSDFDDILQRLTFLGMVGIMDPLRPGVKQAVADCQIAGVVVRMVTGDNITTAKAIALDCGIYHPDSGGIALEGPSFRRMSSEDIYTLLPHLEVLARSSPEDKRRLVQHLKDLGETVAVTGDGTNDAPALKLADIGFSMGIAGTEVAKEASAIILMDDNFGSIVKAIMWGRTVNDAVRKFLQFQLTVNVTAVLLTFVSAVVDVHGTSVLSAVQLLWVNLIMDTFAALALATDPPHHNVLKREPDSKKKPLISATMWKMILGQAIVQLVVTFILYFGGPKWFNVQSEHEREQVYAMVFNCFVWMQFFNMFVSRRLDNGLNMFEGLLSNGFFIAIAVIISGIQVLIMFVGGTAFSIVRQTGAQWGVAVGLGLVSLPAGIVIRLIPDAWAIKIYPQKLADAIVWIWIKFSAGCSWLCAPFTRMFKKPQNIETIVVDDELNTPLEKGLLSLPEKSQNASLNSIRSGNSSVTMV